MRKSISRAQQVEPESIPSQEYVAKERERKYEDSTRYLSEILEQCISDSDLRPRSERELRAGVGLFTEWIGNKPVGNYIRSDFLSFRDECLKRLPSNHNKFEKWKGKPLKEVTKKSAPDEVIQRITINNILSKVHRLFKYALIHDEITHNPSFELGIPAPKGMTRKSKSYSLDELKTLLSILEYDEVRPSRFWIVLLALYQGMRANEICQLHTSDIVITEGIPCLDINEENQEVTHKSVKNDSSYRCIPIHPELIDAGFLRFVEQRRKEVKNKPSLLFSDVRYTKAAGYIRKVSRWFNNTLKPKFIASENKNQRGLHSLRHSFLRQAQNQARMGIQARHELVGHYYDGASDTNADYAGRLSMGILLEELSKLDYELPTPSFP